MKNALSLLSILFVALGLMAQEAKSVLVDFSVHTIKTIKSSEPDNTDLLFFKELLKDKRIVLLGEQSHREGATFEAKVRLIKFLHQQCGFDIVSFESPLYDNYKTFEKLRGRDYRDSPLKESIYSMWSDTKEFEPLLQYIHEVNTSSKPLLVTGFDCQEDDIFKEQYLQEVKETLGTATTLSEKDFTIIEEVIEGSPDFLVENTEDSTHFFQATKKLVDDLEKLKTKDNMVKNSILHQTLVGWLEMIKWQIDDLNEVETKVQNPRDLQMARNLIYLSKLYPNKKIIGWGASYHFADQIERVKNSALTKLYAQRLDSIEQSHEPFDFDESLNGAVPMGKILKQHFGSSLYSLAFSSFEGNFGMYGFASHPLKPIEPPMGSIEAELVQQKVVNAFVDFKNNSRENDFYSSALGNLPVLAPWNKIFDGLFFIKISYAPKSPIGEIIGSNKQATSNVGKPHQPSRKVNVKRLVDKNTKEGIAYANISLFNTSKGVSTNAQGDFVFNVPGAKRTDKVVLSSIGYVTDTLLISDLTKLSQIALMPKVYELADVIFRSKPLTAKEIVKRAEKKIKDNYYQQAHQQEFFYRTKTYNNDSAFFNEEAAVLVANSNGYESSNSYGKSLNGEILQYRNTTKNPQKDIWYGIGSLWLMFSHDVILDKRNVLHHPAYYQLTLKGITSFENKRVYEIGFDCNRPGSYTTGFGYPSPLSATGKIFIDVDTYAVLRFEALIRRKPYSKKKWKGAVLDPFGTHLVQTYRQLNGKYFLNYSKQLHFGAWSYPDPKRNYKYLEIRELLSTEIVTEAVRELTTSVMKIKTKTVAEDANFWLKHNFQVEDNVKDAYKLLQQPK